jgi:serine/threonine protein kinase
MSKPRLLRIRQGDDLVNIEEEQVPYIHKGVLGHGLTAWVEEVEDQFTNKVYARKKMRVVSYTQEERARVFRNELSIIRGLERHHHMIRVFATYITSQYLSLILDPVASDGDLQAYLAMHKRLHDAYAQGNELDPRLASTSLVLQRAFGCLAAGLAFMHENNIRHKDVKPGNILIHHGAVIYTDFGCAFDSSNFTRSTTEGAPSALTRRYSSPELLLQEPRNSKSDVFSLGCVFVEIIAALTRSRSVAHASTQGFAPAMLDDLHEQLSTIQHDSCPVLLIETTIRMTQRQASDRICSTHAAIYLLQYPNLCCHDCSLSPLKDWSKRVKNDDCLPPMAETTLQSQESLSRLSIDPTTVQLSIPQSYPGRTQMEPNSGNNAYTRGSVPSGQGPQRIPPSQTVAQDGYGGILNTRGY